MPREQMDEPRTKWWQGTIVLVVAGVSAQIAGAIAIALALIVKAAMRGDMSSLQQPNLELTFALVAPSVAVTGLTMAAFSFALPMLTKVPMREALGFRGAPWPAFVAAPVGILALGPTSDALRRALVYIAPDFTLGALDTLDGITHSAPVWAVVPVLAFIPGFCEEILFRGAFQRSIRAPVLGILLSGLLFACYHVDPHHVIAVLPLGFYLAWLGARTNSLWVPVTAHIANNATAVVAAVTLESESDDAAAWEEWWLVPVGLAVASVAIAIVWWSTRGTHKEVRVEPLPATAEPASAELHELDVERADLRRAEDADPQG
jgi:membrane protease YdiL (CAAX protease family)